MVQGGLQHLDFTAPVGLAGQGGLLDFALQGAAVSGCLPGVCQCLWHCLISSGMPVPG